MMELGKFYHGKKVLVTGHTGFKGSWLCQYLLFLGAKVSGYSLFPATTPNLHTALKLEKKVSGYLFDIRDFEELRKAFDKEKPEIVFHMAAQPLVRDSYDDPLYTFSTNAMGTANTLECIRNTNSVKSSVIITTDKVYENKEGAKAYTETDILGGHDPYSASKVCAEVITKSYIRSFFKGEKAATARAGNVIGGGDWSKDRIVPDLIRSVFENKACLILRNPNSIRPWQHVLEPLTGYLQLAQRLYEGDNDVVGAWNFAPEESSFITVEDLVNRSIKKLGKGSYSIQKSDDKHETSILKLDAKRAKENLGWRPLLSVDECLEWTMDWYNKFYSGKDVIQFTDNQIADFMERLK